MRLQFRGLVPAALVLSTMAISAQAADLGPSPRRSEWRGPPPALYPAAMRWTGFYAGAQGGWGWGGTDSVSGSGLLSEAFSYSTSGGIGGVHLGYNWQQGQLVWGLETDLELSGIGGSGTGTFGSLHNTNIDWMGSLRGRLGFAAGSTLFYVTGGLAYGGLELTQSNGAGFAPFIAESDWKTGWTLGGGIEHAFSSNVSLRLEYRYTDFGQASFSSSAIGIANSSDVTHSAVRAGFSFRF